MPALQADLKPGGGRFKKVNYLSPDLIYDKSNEWGDYFDKEFLRSLKFSGNSLWYEPSGSGILGKQSVVWCAW